jgi:hypothetical protein
LKFEPEKHHIVIASEAKQSSFLRRDKKAGLLRRFAPRNDGLYYRLP